jgi:cation diffusion facilitator family transporter
MKQNEDARSLQLTLGLYLLIFALKLSVYFMSGVMALLAEALHTLSDIFVVGFLLIAERYSRREADSVHMFGHGRAQNIAALVAATLFISFTSFELYREALPHLFGHELPAYRNVSLALGVLIVSMILAAVPLLKLLRQKSRGAAAKAQFLELKNDELGLLAALIGTLCVLWGMPIADPIAAIVVATIIAVNAVGLFRENMSYLLGRAPSKDVMTQMENLASSVPGVLAVHDFRAAYIGTNAVHTDIHIVVAPNLTVVEAHGIAQEVEDLLKPLLGNGACTIHVDANLAESLLNRRNYFQLSMKQTQDTCNDQVERHNIIQEPWHD